MNKKYTNQKRSVGKRVSPQQKVMLVKYMQEHLEFAHDSIKAKNANENKTEMWNTLTDKLNAINGATKTTEQWKKCWIDLKLCTKEKVLKLKEKAYNYNGMQDRIDILSDVEEQIFSIISTLPSSSSVVGTLSQLKKSPRGASRISNGTRQIIPRTSSESRLSNGAKSRLEKLCEVIKSSNSIDSRLSDTESRLEKNNELIKSSHSSESKLDLLESNKILIELSKQKIEIRLEKNQILKRRNELLEIRNKIEEEKLELLKTKIYVEKEEDIFMDY